MSAAAGSAPSFRPRVLVVEDDLELSGLLAEVLLEEGYDVEVARDGQRGLHLGLSNQFDVLVVDRGLPAVEGVDLVRRLRRSGVDAPVLLLTARGTVADRVEGLDAGAEDYLVKPFDLEELLARLRALLRRGTDDAEVLPIGAGRLVVGQRLVLLPVTPRAGGGSDATDMDGSADGSRSISLSPRESDLLELLARRPNQVFTREDLLTRVFGDADTPGAVDTYVHYLRRKLGRQVVMTIRGIGYRLGRL